MKKGEELLSLVEQGLSVKQPSGYESKDTQSLLREADQL